MYSIILTSMKYPSQNVQVYAPLKSSSLKILHKHQNKNQLLSTVPRQEKEWLPD